MGRKVSTSIILYKSQIKKNGKHPLKLRVTFNRVQKYFGIDTKDRAYEFTKEEYNKLISPKPRGIYKEINLELSLIENKAQNVISSIEDFTFKQFKTKFGIRGGDLTNLLYFFDKRIDELKENNQFSSHRNNLSSKHNLEKFFKNPKRIDFRDLSVSMLDKFERYLLDKGLSPSTVRCYTVSIRTIFRMAQREGVIPSDLYPFGADGYQIPIGRNIKKALRIEEIEQIYNYQTPQFSKIEEARDMWLFSYFMNGANIADIARLKYRNISGHFITFIRKKTEKTSKRLKPISVPITPEITRIIDKWGNEKKSADTLVFNILDESMTAQQRHKKTVVYIQFINRYMKIIGEALKIEKPITTYTARHSFSTVLKRSGVSTEFIGESLGHNDVRTTEFYLDSFEDDMKMEYAKHLSSFRTNASA